MKCAHTWRKLIILAMVSVLFLAAPALAGIAPVADFTANVTSGEAPLAVQFTDASTGDPTLWAWDFENDGIVDSTEQSPTHTYTSAGTYTVNLTVTNAAGTDSLVKTDYITVTDGGSGGDAPVANFTSNVTAGEAPLSVQFTDASSESPTSWAWDFENDGVVDSTEQNPSHTYTVAGTYTVNLTVTNAAGSDAEAKTGFITVIPSSATIELPRQNGLNLSVVNKQRPGLYDTEHPGTYFFNIGNNIYNGGQNAIHISDSYLTADGTITVSNSSTGTFYITDTGGKGYEDEAILLIAVQENELSEDFSIDLTVDGYKFLDHAANVAPTVDEVGTFNSEAYVATLNASDFLTYDGALVSQAWKPSTGSAGDVNMKLFDGQDLAGPKYNLILVDLNTSIVGRNAAYQTTLTNYGNPKVTYTIHGYSGGNVSFAPYAYVSYQTGGGSYFDRTVGWASRSSTNSWLVTLEEAGTAPVANFTANVTSGDAPLAVQFTDLSAGDPTSWAWDFENDGVVDSTEQNPAHTYTAVGTYTINLTVSNAAGSDSEVKTDYITVSSGGSGSDTPVANFTANVTGGKAPLTVQFTDLSSSSPTSWLWNFGDGTTATEQNPVHAYATIGEYDVSLTATNANGSNTTTKTGYIVARNTNAVPLPAGQSFNLYVANDEGVKYNVENGVTNPASYTPYVFINNTYHFLYNGQGGGTNALHVSNDPSNTAGQVTTTTNQSGEFWFTFTGGQPNLHDAVLLLAVNGTIPDDFSVRIRSSGYDFEPPIPDIINNNTIGTPTYVDGAINQTFTREDFIYGPQIWRPHRVSDYPVFVGQDMSDTENTFELMFIDLRLGCTQTESDGYIKVEYDFNNLTSFAVFNGYGWYSASNHGTGLIMTTSGSEYQVVGDGGSSDPELPVANFTANVTSGDAPLNVQFTDASTGSPAAWTWDFENDGVVDSTEQSPSFTYTTAGTYTVNLTVTNAAGSNTTTKADYITASNPYPQPLPAYRNINIYVANDEGVKYDEPNGITRYGDIGIPYNYVPNTYFVMFGTAGGGTNPMDISNDPAGRKGVDGQITRSTNQSGAFWVTFNGGQSYMHEGILLLAVNGTIPDDFSVRIRSSGYDFVAPIPSVGNNDTISDLAYVEGAVDQIFTKEDFIYGPQIWRPFGTPDLPIYCGQDMSDTENTFQLMFIDLNLGATKTGTDQGSIKVEYQFNNLTTFAVFNSYGWYRASNHGTGIIMSNYGSDYAVIGDGTYAPVAPVADFTANVTSGDAPLAVQFTDASTGSPTAWAWDFENDGTVDSTEQSPTHTYTSAGTYTVNLTVTNADGSDGEVKTDYITVGSGGSGGDAPVASFTANVTSGEAPLTVQFTDASTGSPTSWSWDFENDGIIDSIEQNPLHTYTAAGTYTVNLTVGNAAGSDAEVKTDYLTVTGGGAPAANFTATPLSGEAPLAVQFIDASTNVPASWAWDFENDGVIDSTAQNPEHTYTTTGTYSVNLTVANDAGTDSIVRTGYIRVEGARVVTPSGGGGSGGGGRSAIGVGAAENVKAGETVTLTFDEAPVSEIVIHAQNDIPDILVTTEAGKRPEDADAPDGDVYEYVSITSYRAPEDSLQWATIRFSVPASWVDERLSSPDLLSLYRYDEETEEWILLSTVFAGEENGGYAYYADSASLGYFAIVVKPDVKEVTVSPVTSAGDRQESPEAGGEVASADPATTAKATPVFGGGMIVCVSVALFGVFVLLNRRLR